MKVNLPTIRKRHRFWLMRPLKISSVLVLGLVTILLMLLLILLFPDILFLDVTEQLTSYQISVSWCLQLIKTIHLLFKMTSGRTSMTAASVLVKRFIQLNNWKLVVLFCFFVCFFFFKKENNNSRSRSIDLS